MINCALYFTLTAVGVFFREEQIAIWRPFDFQFVGKTTEISRLRDSRPGIKTPHTVSTAVRCLLTLRSRVCGETRCSCYYTGHGITVSWSVMFITAVDLIPPILCHIPRACSEFRKPYVSFDSYRGFKQLYRFICVALCRRKLNGYSDLETCIREMLSVNL